MDKDKQQKLKKSVKNGAVAGLVYSLTMLFIDVVIREVEADPLYYVWIGMGFFVGMSCFYYFFERKKQ